MKYELVKDGIVENVITYDEQPIKDEIAQYDADMFAFEAMEKEYETNWTLYLARIKIIYDRVLADYSEPNPEKPDEMVLSRKGRQVYKVEREKTGVPIYPTRPFLPRSEYTPPEGYELRKVVESAPAPIVEEPVLDSSAAGIPNVDIFSTASGLTQL